LRRFFRPSFLSEEGAKDLEKQLRAPLYEALLFHAKRSPGNFHVPGHKQGRVFDAEGIERFGPVLDIDLTELSPLDDLHDPAGIIAEAQALAAEAFGADATFFLVGGSTAGNLAAILSCCRPGEVLLVQRSSHQSVFHGCLLAGVRPVYLGTRVDERSGLEQGIDPENLEAALDHYPEAKGVVVTSPSYFGVVQPIERFAEICHRRGVPLIVDEAHGAHFGFHPDLPPPAIRCGADLAVQSTHKMLPAMTMASMLHVKGERIPRERLARWLRILQSSSPSYPLMASLDLARRVAATEGRERLDVALARLAEIRKRVASFRRLEEAVGSRPQDPLKLTIQSKTGTSGYRMAEWLENRDCFPELADHRRVLFTFSLGDPGPEGERLVRLLMELDEQLASVPAEPALPFPKLEGWQEGEVLAGWMEAAGKAVPLDRAVGSIAADMVVPYPPGIPLILPGERWTGEKAEFLQRVIEAGGRVRGLPSVSPPRVSVLE
jgi:arginine decarboxylase